MIKIDRSAFRCGDLEAVAAGGGFQIAAYPYCREVRLSPDDRRLCVYAICRPARRLRSDRGAIINLSVDEPRNRLVLGLV